MSLESRHSTDTWYGWLGLKRPHADISQKGGIVWMYGIRGHSHPSSGCYRHHCFLQMLSSGTAPRSGALEGIRTRPTFKLYPSGVMGVAAEDPKGELVQGAAVSTAHSRMLALSLDIAATASSCVANSTSASPVTLPSGPTSTWTRTGFNGEKNCGGGMGETTLHKQ